VKQVQSISNNFLHVCTPFSIEMITIECKSSVRSITVQHVIWRGCPYHGITWKFQYTTRMHIWICVSLVLSRNTIVDVLESWLAIDTILPSSIVYSRRRSIQVVDYYRNWHHVICLFEITHRFWISNGYQLFRITFDSSSIYDKLERVINDICIRSYRWQ
jgi:hypothetical protein